VNRWVKTAAAVVAATAGGYGGWAMVAYARYGRTPRRRTSEHDALLDQFLPEYDVYERHSIVVNATPEATLVAARNQDLFDAPLVNAIFTVRGWAMGATPQADDRGQGLLGTTLALGWRVLDDVPGREIVVGAVTRPWQANVIFRGIAPDAFPSFSEPDYVKIAWTLRVDPLDNGTRCVFTTETRALATDEEAARKFRRYWAFASPGIGVIRRLGLPALKRRAERTGITGEPSPRPSEPFRQPAP
jgi:hypothetical protein